MIGVNLSTFNRLSSIGASVPLSAVASFVFLSAAVDLWWWTAYFFASRSRIIEIDFERVESLKLRGVVESPLFRSQRCVWWILSQVFAFEHLTSYSRYLRSWWRLGRRSQFGGTNPCLGQRLMVCC